MLEMVQAGFHEEEFLHLAAAAEASSEHPLGKAVTAHARARLQQRSAAGETIIADSIEQLMTTMRGSA